MQDPRFVRKAFQEIADRYVVTNHVLSCGIDVLWRRRLAGMVAESAPVDVLDLATGSGDLAEAVTRTCPGARVIGADFCEPMLRQASGRGLRALVVADAMRLPFADASFDAVTVAFGLRNMEAWDGAVREMARVMRPGGRLFVLDFSLPRSAMVRPLYRFYLHRVLPTVAGWMTGRREAYEYLAGSIETFPSGGAMTAMLEGNGFRNAAGRPLTLGVASIYTAERPAESVTSAAGDEVSCGDLRTTCLA